MRTNLSRDEKKRIAEAKRRGTGSITTDDGSTLFLSSLTYSQISDCTSSYDSGSSYSSSDSGSSYSDGGGSSDGGGGGGCD